MLLQKEVTQNMVLVTIWHYKHGCTANLPARESRSVPNTMGLITNLLPTACLAPGPCGTSDQIDALLHCPIVCCDRGMNVSAGLYKRHCCGRLLESPVCLLLHGPPAFLHLPSARSLHILYGHQSLLPSQYCLVPTCTAVTNCSVSCMQPVKL